MQYLARDHWLWGLVLVGLTLALGLSNFVRLLGERAPGPPLGQLINFQLTDSQGRAFTPETLRGRVWLGALFFTRCGLTCPRLIEAMKRLQDRLAASGVHLVAFTVEASHDSPDVLKAFADAVGADPNRWTFVTGDRETIQRLARESFFASVVEDPTQPVGFELTHSDRLYLVDGTGSVRQSFPVIRSVDPLAKTPLFAIHERELRRAQVAALELAHPAWPPLGQLPLLNATLNGVATILLAFGFLLVRARWVQAHAATMIGAFTVSAAFLASYLYYHAQAGDTPYTGQGTMRWVYFSILISHVVLAVVTVPLVLVTFYRAARRQWEGHRRMGWWTLPIWFYVSLTGLIVYLLLYEFHGAG